MAGAIAAVLSTLAGLLLTASGALGHDVYTTVINPNATQKQRVRAGKISVIIMVLKIFFGIDRLVYPYLV